MLGHFKKAKIDTDNPKTTIGAWVKEQEKSCYICDYYKNTYNRYLDTSLNFTEKIRNLKSFLKTAKVSASPISQIL